MSHQKNNARRLFLTAGAATAGALVLGAKSGAAETTTAAAAAPPDEVSLPLKTHGSLAKIGGSAVVEAAGDKIIVAHVAAETFAACSAICTHKGCTVTYEHDVKQFVCPCHGARFSLGGKVLQGPAKKPLRAYSTDTAALVSLAPKTPEIKAPDKKSS